MFKIISVLLNFLKELVFESREQYLLNSAHFDARKVLLYVMLVGSLLLNYVLSTRITLLAAEVKEHRQEQCELKNPSTGSSDSLQ